MLQTEFSIHEIASGVAVAESAVRPLLAAADSELRAAIVGHETASLPVMMLVGYMGESVVALATAAYSTLPGSDIDRHGIQKVIRLSWLATSEGQKQNYDTLITRQMFWKVLRARRSEQSHWYGQRVMAMTYDDDARNRQVAYSIGLRRWGKMYPDGSAHRLAQLWVPHTESFQSK